MFSAVWAARNVWAIIASIVFFIAASPLPSAAQDPIDFSLAPRSFDTSLRAPTTPLSAPPLAASPAPHSHFAPPSPMAPPVPHAQFRPPAMMTEPGAPYAAPSYTPAPALVARREFPESIGLSAEPGFPSGFADETPYGGPDDEPWGWFIRPSGFLYSTYWASAAEPRLAVHVVEEKDRGTLLDSHIAGRLGLLRYGPRNRPVGFQLDVLAGAKLRQDPDDGMDVLGSDFRYDILGTFRQGRHEFKFGFYHVSAHAGDEFLLKNPGFDRQNFYRDVLVAGYAFRPYEDLRLYAEAGWAFQTDVSKPWEFQFGVDYGPARPTGIAGAPFFALNGHLREELDFGGNFALQAGWAWRGERPGDGLLRTGLYYYNGGSPQFSFYNENEQQIGWGLWYDY